MDISNELLERFADLVAEKLAEKMLAAAEPKKQKPEPVAQQNRRVSFAEAREILGISKSAYYNNREKFPKPHRMGKLLFWWSEELEQFAKEEMAENA